MSSPDRPVEHGSDEDGSREHGPADAPLQWLAADADGRAALDAEGLALVRELAGLAPLLAPAPERHAPHGMPATLGRYTLEHQLGSGGLGRVYRAFDTQLHRHVALKLLDAGPAASGGEHDRLLAEARALARLEDEGVVEVHEVAEHDGQPFLVMELVEGPTLAAVLAVLRGADDSEPTPEAAAAAVALADLDARLRLVEALARSVAHCHASGVLHRDLKPANVLLTADGRPKIVDFGLSHRAEDEAEGTLTIGFVGTPAYLAPEQVLHRRTGAAPASDVFALGVLLYELVTLRHPFLRPTLVDTHAAILRDEPPPPRRLEPRVRPELEHVLLAALQKDPRERLPSAARLADDLRAVREHRAVSVGRPSALARLRRLVRRHRGAARALAAAAVLVVVASVVLFGLARSRAAKLVDALDEALAAAAALPLEDPGGAPAWDAVQAALRDCGAHDRSLLGALDLRTLLASARARVGEHVRERVTALVASRAVAAERRDWIARRQRLVALHDAVEPALRRWRELAPAIVAPLSRDPLSALTPGTQALALDSDEAYLDQRRFVARTAGAVERTELLLLRAADDSERSGWRESLHVVSPEDPPVPLAPAPLAKHLEDDMVVVDVGAWRSAQGFEASSWQRLEVLPRLVTWRDLEPLLPPEEYRHLRLREETFGARVSRGVAGPDDPAMLQPHEVLYVAGLAGARLPTPNELRALWSATEGEPVLPPLPSGWSQEWVACLAPTSARLGYMRVADGGPVDLDYSNGHFEAGAGFRLVRSVGPPRAR